MTSTPLSSYHSMDEGQDGGNDHAVASPLTPDFVSATSSLSRRPVRLSPPDQSGIPHHLYHHHGNSAWNPNGATSGSHSVATAASMPNLESSDRSVYTATTTTPTTTVSSIVADKNDGGRPPPSYTGSSNQSQEHDDTITNDPKVMMMMMIPTLARPPQAQTPPAALPTTSSSIDHPYNSLMRPAWSRSRSSMGGVDSFPAGNNMAFQGLFPRIILPKVIRQRWFQQYMTIAALTAFVLVGIVTSQVTPLPHIRVAMIGNSMMYYNDFPRFLEAMSQGSIEQDSCLHGDATLHSILITGSGTFDVWRTGVAVITNASVELYHENYDEEEEQQQEYNSRYDFTRLYDYGACTVPQLLFGYDKNLDQKMEDWAFDETYESHGDDFFDDDDYYALDHDDEIYAYDFDSFMDGSNPCLMDPNYYAYRNYLYWGGDSNNQDDENFQNNGQGDDNAQDDLDRHNLYPTAPQWDYIILNDNTRSPANYYHRQDTLSILEQQYLLWFQETKSIPILMFTYAYDTPYRDMDGFRDDQDGDIDIPTFTSLTYEGYRQYAALLSQRLPEEQQPRIAPVGLAFLTVWEESYEFWKAKLFHVDRIHASPHGTYLQGCVVYCTIYGKLPSRKTALDDMESLWNDARRMAPVRHRRLPLPTREEATYLYHVAERVCLQGHIPRSFVFYENGESTTYIPSDDAFANDDIY
ncbi:expressed unknown protein [Seminavis robusta]|uniref:Uncharacterized protein n=1 Tax=Seminavis robusta TaxID=568900 RepID=A0A9N8F033_9STRA|nr:expressed unknown protein [Seminavis robusta]|eukprot:Sro2354_g324520.1 n/a (694) ;mRNA; r:10847-12928